MSLLGHDQRDGADLYPTRRSVASLKVRRRRDPVVYASVAKTVIGEPALREYRSRGFVRIQGLFEPAEISALQSELDRLRADAALAEQPIVITEPESGALRSVFEIHRISPLFARLTQDSRLVDMAHCILGSDVYLHQTRVNYKPGLYGKEFYWHSDFETWHAEDGLPRMRTVSMSISLTDNSHLNGPLLLIPRSHLVYVPCAGETPDQHYLSSLRKQEVGIPGPAELEALIARGGIEAATGPAGTLVVFDCNTMHGSNSNISPYPRANVFLVYNSILNRPLAPFSASTPRPAFLAERKDLTAIQPITGSIVDGR